MNAPGQFRVLYREFLFRFVDVELLSGSARGDAHELLGQFGALLIFGSLILAWAALAYSGVRLGPDAAATGAWSRERMMISVTMLAVGVFMVLSWDATFLDRRDALVLGPLPVGGRTLFAAKAAALGSSLLLTVAALNVFSGFAWPLVLAPPGAGMLGTARSIAAFWIALPAAGAFLSCAVLAVQGVVAQLPRKWYLRVSPLVQMALLTLIVAGIFLQPSFPTADALLATQNQRMLHWLPTYWFTGLLSELSGAYSMQARDAMAPLARRAVTGLLAAMGAAGVALVLSYLRALQKMVEEPDVLPGTRGGMWLPRFGTPLQTALTQFVIRTLLRSRQHRVILAFYLGGGFALVTLYLEALRELKALAGMDWLWQVSTPVLVASAVMLVAWMMGARMTFSLPVDLRANWIFRVTPVPGGKDCATASRRALLMLSVVPVCAGVAAVLLWFWPWPALAQHLLLLTCAGSLLVDLSLRRFRKIPFTCSYLPGKTKIHMVFWFGVIPVILAIHKSAELEQRAMASPPVYWAVVVVLGTAALAARWLAARNATRREPELQFEESRSDELLSLGVQDM